MDRFDELDRERFKDMIQSAPFSVFINRILQELERRRGTAERHDSSIKEIRIAQGAAAALRMVLALPNQMLSEMKGKTK